MGGKADVDVDMDVEVDWTVRVQSPLLTNEYPNSHSSCI